MENSGICSPKKWHFSGKENTMRRLSKIKQVIMVEDENLRSAGIQSPTEEYCYEVTTIKLKVLASGFVEV